ncbi:MAG TPA: hypothetical protein VH137_10745 [Gemmatimonadales bacterium]|nr:hypothetical protein [Gemmatimonadales bacterium]
MPHPLTLHQLSECLGCSAQQVIGLMAAHCFPHAYLDRDGQWRVPVADAAAYIRSRGDPREAARRDLQATAVA